MPRSIGVWWFLLLATGLSWALTVDAPQQLEVCACESFSYPVQVLPSRGPAQTFDLSVHAPSSLFSVTHAPQSISSAGMVEAVVYGTAACKVLPGTYAFELAFISRAYPVQVETARTNLRVRDCTNLKASLQPVTSACACGTGRYDVVLQNQGAWAVPVALRTSDAAATLSSTEVLVPAGQNRTVPVYVTLPCADQTKRPLDITVHLPSGVQTLTTQLEPEQCTAGGVALLSVSIPTPIPPQPSTLVAVAQVAPTPSPFSGLFAGALSTGPWALLLLLLIGLFAYALRNREFVNPFQSTDDSKMRDETPVPTEPEATQDAMASLPEESEDAVFELEADTSDSESDAVDEQGASQQAPPAEIPEAPEVVVVEDQTDADAQIDQLARDIERARRRSRSKPRRRAGK